MTAGRVVGVVLAFAAVGLLALGWQNLGLLRGTILWDLRYPAFAVAAFLTLSLLERIGALVRKPAPDNG